MTAHRFGRGTPFTVGIEEELLLVDPATHALAHVAEDVLPRIDAPPGAVGHEAFACELELRSPPCPHAAAAAAALDRHRAAARAAGATLMGAGLHPTAPWGGVRLVRSERYQRVEQTMRGLIRRNAECALHVHVGMPDAETAVRALNALRSRLPLLIALAANSPWWFGTDSGLASSRWSFVRAYPRRGAPRAFRDWEDYAGAAEATRVAGDLVDDTFLWWDVRLHPHHGTVEVREMDVQCSLEHTAALTALVHAIALMAADGDPEPDPPTEALAESCFRASRDGLAAPILLGDRLVPVADAAARTLRTVRPHARNAGADAALDGVEEIVATGNGADRQRAVHLRAGDAGLLAWLVEQTARGYSAPAC